MGEGQFLQSFKQASSEPTAVSINSQEFKTRADLIVSFKRYYIFAASTVNSGPLFLISEKLIFFVASYLKTHNLEQIKL